MDNPDCRGHEGHTHPHGPCCGPVAVRHNGPTDYLHDGRLHHPHGNHCDDHGPVNVGASCSGFSSPSTRNCPGREEGPGKISCPLRLGVW
jgi:hypothetical protein